MAELTDYIKAKKTLKEFEDQTYRKVVKPITCACCKKETVNPDFEWTSELSPIDQERGMWNGGTVCRLSPGFGSAHDMSSYFLALCDSCITQLAETGIIKSRKEVREECEKLHTIKNESGRVYETEVERFADLMTVEDWNSSVELGMFDNDDGCGYWVKDGLESRDEVFNSEQEDATHVAWYNK